MHGDIAYAKAYNFIEFIISILLTIITLYIDKI